MSVVGAYYGERGGQRCRIEVRPHWAAHPSGQDEERSARIDGYRIVWSDGSAVTIERGREDTVTRYLLEWNARSVQEIVRKVAS